MTSAIVPGNRLQIYYCKSEHKSRTIQLLYLVESFIIYMYIDIKYIYMCICLSTINNNNNTNKHNLINRDIKYISSWKKRS